MEMLFYLLLAAVLYGLLADRTDRAVEREMKRRRVQPGQLQLEEDGVRGSIFVLGIMSSCVPPGSAVGSEARTG